MASSVSARGVGETNIDSSTLPISTRVSVLGAEIVIYARAMHEEMYEGKSKGGLDGEVNVEALHGVGNRLRPSTRKGIASWARRNLFNGAGPK